MTQSIKLGLCVREESGQEEETPFKLFYFYFKWITASASAAFLVLMSEQGPGASSQAGALWHAAQSHPTLSGMWGIHLLPPVINQDFETS